MSLYKHRLDRELSESENRYRSLFEDNKNIMLIIDPANGEIMDAKTVCGILMAQRVRNGA